MDNKNNIIIKYYFEIKPKIKLDKNVKTNLDKINSNYEDDKYNDYIETYVNYKLLDVRIYKW